MGMLYDAMKAGSPLLLTAGQHDQAMNLTEPILRSEALRRARAGSDSDEVVVRYGADVSGIQREQGRSPAGRGHKLDLQPSGS
jgi:hypothetical protein